MTPDEIMLLGEGVADIAATVGDVNRVVFTEYADGSRRKCALVEVIDGGEHEQEFRVISPAPFNSPAWAAPFTERIIEVRTGETWMTLESEPVA